MQYYCCNNPDVVELDEEPTILPSFEMGIRKNLKCLSCGAKHELRMEVDRSPVNLRGEVKQF